jgi:hypothetical protein
VRSPTAASTNPAASRRRAAREPPLELPDLPQKLVHRKERRPPREPHERHLERRPRLTASNNIIE